MSGTQINPGLTGVFLTQKSAYEYALRLHEKGVAIKDATMGAKTPPGPAARGCFLFACAMIIRPTSPDSRFPDRP